MMMTAVRGCMYCIQVRHETDGAMPTNRGEDTAVSAPEHFLPPQFEVVLSGTSEDIIGLERRGSSKSS